MTDTAGAEWRGSARPGTAWHGKDIPAARFLTIAEAAQRVGVSQRTIRSWVHRGHLQPIPLSKDMLGRHLYAEPRVVAAERATRQADTTGRSQARIEESA